jgi:predicted aspartyl protease
MSTFTYPALVASPRGGRPPVEIKLLVDTGAMFTCLPAPQLEALGLAPTWRVPIALADGRHDEWGATEIALTLDGRTLHTTCLFGPPGSLPLLGAVSLEQFALAVDPLTRGLVPTRVPMAVAVVTRSPGLPAGGGPVGS